MVTSNFISVVKLAGIDMSGFDCNAMNQADWDCLVNNGYDFAIIQTWEGGYGYTSHIGKSIS